MRNHIVETNQIGNNSLTSDPGRLPVCDIRAFHACASNPDRRLRIKPCGSAQNEGVPWPSCDAIESLFSLESAVGEGIEIADGSQIEGR